MENLSRCHREKSGKRLLPHSTYILQHKNDIVKNNKYAEKVVFCFIKPKKRKINNSVCRKSMFFKKSACPQSLSPNPFPRERGYFAGATAPRPCRGLRPCDPIYIIKRFIDSLQHPRSVERGCLFLCSLILAYFSGMTTSEQNTLPL